MTGINKVILLGRLGNDPEFNQTASGMKVAKCSLATSSYWKDASGQRQEKTEWHRVVFFNRLAEVVSQYLKKGMQVYVEGRLQTNKWEKDGVTRYTTEIIAQEMQMLGSRQEPDGESQYQNTSNNYNQPAAANQPNQAQSSPGQGNNKGMNESYDDIDQDIPF